MADKMVWLGLGGIQNDFRKKIGLSSIMRGSSLVSKLKIPHIYCMSPHLAPKPTVAPLPSAPLLSLLLSPSFLFLSSWWLNHHIRTGRSILMLLDFGIWICRPITSHLKIWLTSSPLVPLQSILDLDLSWWMTLRPSGRCGSLACTVVQQMLTMFQNVIEGVIQSKQRAIISPGWAKLGIHLVIIFLLCLSSLLSVLPPSPLLTHRLSF